MVILCVKCLFLYYKNYIDKFTNDGENNEL